MSDFIFDKLELYLHIVLYLDIKSILALEQVKKSFRLTDEGFDYLVKRDFESEIEIKRHNQNYRELYMESYSIEFNTKLSLDYLFCETILYRRSKVDLTYKHKSLDKIL